MKFKWQCEIFFLITKLNHTSGRIDYLLFYVVPSTLQDLEKENVWSHGVSGNLSSPKSKNTIF